MSQFPWRTFFTESHDKTSSRIGKSKPKTETPFESVVVPASMSSLFWKKRISFLSRDDSQLGMRKNGTRRQGSLIGWWNHGKGFPWRGGGEHSEMSTGTKTRSCLITICLFNAVRCLWSGLKMESKFWLVPLENMCRLRHRTSTSGRWSVHRLVVWESFYIKADANDQRWC